MRELNIINDLIESKDYLPLEYFINKYSISKRTLQNEFSYLSSISKKRGFHLIQKRGSGYLLEVLDEEKFSEFRHELRKLSEGPKVSAENIIAYLSFREKYESTENLIQIFKSSKSTFKGFKREVDDYLRNFNLKMERKAHYGLRIEEKLKLRRKLLIHLYTMGNEFVVDEVDFYVDERFEKIQKCFIDDLKEKEAIINYTELTQLVIWLKIVIYINLKEKTALNKNMDMKIIEKIGKQFKVGIESADIEEFKALIKRKSRSIKKDEEFLEELEFELSMFLGEIDKENKTSFNKDENFKQLLLTHVAALVSRLKKNISYKNPIIDEIAIKYPMVFNVAIALGNRLKEKYNVVTTRDEIGFITTYFILHMEKEVLEKLKNYKKIAIVCSSGGGSSYLIKLKLESLFSKANIETFSILQIENLEEYRPDIIFSITDLTLKIETPVVYIKELLSDLDILNIKQLVMFEKFDKVAAGKTKEYFLKKFFNPMYFSIETEEIEYIKCLEEMSREIEEEGIGGENYSEYVLKREEFTSTIYLNGIGIPHPIEMKGNEDLISVKIFKNPIIHEGRKVNIIFMVSLKKDSLEFHKGITNDLFEIMNNEEKVQALIKVKSFKEFIILINKYKKV